MSKRDRHAAILDLVRERHVTGQEVLRNLLVGKGFEVTQATVSRDVRDLRLVKVPGATGAAHYTLPDEWEKARIEGARLLPLPELPERLTELADWKAGTVVVYCHAGVRSEMAAQILLDAGFAGVSSMTGGIEAWSATVDPNVPLY